MFSSIVMVIVSPFWNAVTLLVGVPPPSSPHGPSFSGAPTASWLIQDAGSSRVKCAWAGRDAVVTSAAADTAARTPQRLEVARGDFIPRWCSSPRGASTGGDARERCFGGNRRARGG